MIDYLLHGATVNGYYLFAVPQVLGILWLLGLGVLGVGVAWAANLTQPRPDWGDCYRPTAPVRGGRRRRT